MTKNVQVIIVNWNAGQQLAEAVKSLVEHGHGIVEAVVVVDNASTDDSLAQVEAIGKFPFALQIIRNAENRGFAAACNQGAVFSKSEYLLFLNPDTRLFENSLIVPIAFMQDIKNQSVGIVGIQLIDESRVIARDCARFPTTAAFIAKALGINHVLRFKIFNTHMSEWKHDSSRQVDQVIGAFFCIRRALFQHLHGFDEQYFLYYEEVDLSLRANKVGYSSFYLAESQAFHARGGTSRQVKVHRLFYSLRSRLQYSFKNFPYWQAWLLVLITALIEPVSRSVFSLLRGSLSDVSNTLRAFAMLYGALPKIIIEAHLSTVKK